MDRGICWTTSRRRYVADTENHIEEAVERFVPKKTRTENRINPFGGTRKSKEPEGEETKHGGSTRILVYMEIG